MRIVSLSTVYPHAAEPGLGLFVESRLRAIANRCDLRVVAPVPLVDYKRRIPRLAPPSRPATNSGSGPDVFRPRWFYPPGGTPLNPFCLFARLLPLMRSLQRRAPFDILDAHFCYPEGVTAALLAARLRVPFAITLRGSELVFARSRSRLATMRYALRRAAAVITVSEELRDFAIREGAAASAVHVIPNGVDADVFFPRDPHRMRSNWKVTLGRQLIVSAGELIEAKGHHLLIQAAERLIRAGLDIEVVIAGRTGRGGKCYESELRRLVSELRLESRIRFAGHVGRQGLAELLSAADVFCLASYTEGWPNVVHEALSCGTPVVVSDVGGVRAMVPDVQYGFVVPSRNADALEAALSQGLRKSWDRAAIAEWGSSRSWSQVASEVLEVFEGVLARTGKRQYAAVPEALSAT